MPEAGPANGHGLPPFRSMERMLSALGGWDRERTAVGEAENIVYDAWEAPTEARAVAPAKKALSVWADCADAYNLLAEMAGFIEEATALYREGVAAGERALGKEAFEKDVGHSWGVLVTRPYMRARAGLARCLWMSGQRDEAVTYYREMLRLNPGDNQGMRYGLISCLLEMGRDEVAEGLLKEYEDDSTATWAYSRALLEFRRGGDCEAAREALEAAIKCNPHVPAYLAGRKRLPDRLPDYVSLGDDSEAVAYAGDNGACWGCTHGALAWLAANAAKAAPAGAGPAGELLCTGPGRLGDSTVLLRHSALWAVAFGA